VVWVKSQDELLWWLFVASVAMFLVTPLAVGWIVVRLPADYFTAKSRQPPAWRSLHPALWLLLLMVKNLAGIFLLLAGLVMLVVPGQGLLTLAVGLILIDFPGKFHVERWLTTRQPVWRSINWLRRRAGREALHRP
jgi:hypothetical protein